MMKVHEGRLEAMLGDIMSSIEYGFAPALLAIAQGVSQSRVRRLTMDSLPFYAHDGNTPPTPGIYAIVNLQNNDAYIGSTISLYRRQQEHFRELRKGSHKNKHLQSAYNLYEIDNFAFYIVELVDEKANLLAREQHYIDTLSPEYNLSPTAGNTLGTKRSEEARQRMSIARRKWTLSPESIALGVAKRTGRKYPKEFGEAISVRQKGSKHSEEARAKMSKARKGKPRPPEEVQKSAQSRTGLKRSAEAIEKTANWHKGKKRSEESKARMSEAQKRKLPVSDETRAKISKAGMGRVISEEARRKSSEKQKGRVFSEETRIKMSIAAKNRRKRDKDENKDSGVI